MSGKLWKTLSGMALITLATASLAASPNIARSVAVKLSPDRHELKELKRLGYRILGVDYENHRVAILLDEEEQILDWEQFKVESVQTIQRDKAPDDGYHSPDEVAAKLAAWQAAHTDIMSVETIGQSSEGRDILAVKISDQAMVSERAEPAILFNAMHHAREVMTVEVALDIIEQLVTGYANDETIRAWVDANEIWVVPMLNPDGNQKVWLKDNMWRKNTRGGHGIDLNRNYPYAWNSCNGSSSYENADDYHGPSAASEPEVRAMMDFVTRIKPVFDISYHSYSELVLAPYGCDGKYSSDHETIKTIGQELAGKLVRDSGRGSYDFGTPWELLYSVDGGDIDWMHHELGVIPYVIEVSAMAQGFQPEYSWRQPTVEKMRAGWQLLLEKLGGSGLRGFAKDTSGKIASAGRVMATSLSESGKIFQGKIHADGGYHLVMPAGMYRLEFLLGNETTSQNVIIGASRLDLH